MTTQASSPRPAASQGTVSIVLCAAIGGFYVMLYPVTQPDHFKFLLPWLRAITNSDGMSAFATDFSNYTGGYIIVLAGFAAFEGTLSELAIIKVTAVLGTGLSALGVAFCLRAAGWQTHAAVNGGLLFALLPAVMLNGIGWGQADAFYTAFVLYSMAALISGRPVMAALWFCVAISIKLQAILFAPFLIGALLRSPRAILIGVLALVPIYLLVNTIYLISGRPLSEVLMIYADQAQTFRRMSMNAGNLWYLLDGYAPQVVAAHYRGLVLAGVGLAALASLALIWRTHRSKYENLDLLSLAATTTLVLPFILPKMHERFFFMGEALVFVCCLLERRFIPAAIALQLSAICMYSIYHDTLFVRQVIGWPLVAFAGISLMICSLLLIFIARRGLTTRADTSDAESGLPS
jgi:Gpi18-like mannosyltransferase